MHSLNYLFVISKEGVMLYILNSFKTMELNKQPQHNLYSKLV